MPPTHTHRHDLPARIIAFAVFLLGIGLLCLVFSLAWALFHVPPTHLATTTAPGGAAAPLPAAEIGLSLAAFARQLLLLVVMTVAGSVVASKGIHLYFSAHPPAAPAPPPSSPAS